MSVLSKLFKPFMRYHVNTICLEEWKDERASLKHNAFMNTVGWRKRNKRTIQYQ